MIRAVPKISVPCHAWPCQDLGTRSWYQDLGTKILVPRSWYQDPGTRTGAPAVLQAVVQMCAWGLFAIYIYTSGDPCIYMHVVILILMLQQSQVLWPQKLNLFCWRRRRCIKAKYTIALGPDEAESRRKKRWQLHALLVPQECQKHPKTVLLKPLAAKWDTSTSCQPFGRRRQGI